MSWEKSSYTKAGAALLSESLSGGAVTITRAVSGTGTVDTDLSEETAVSGDMHELSLLSIETVKDDGKAARKVNIQTSGAESAYVMHQIGVFGVLNDGTETLLFLMQDERGIEIPAAGTNSGFSFEIAVLLAVSAEASLSLTVDPQVQALMKLVKTEIEKHNADPASHEDTIRAVVQEQLDNASSGCYGSYELTLLASGWKSIWDEGSGIDTSTISGYYQYIYDAELSDCTSELVPSGGVWPDSFYISNAAGVLNGCETHDGFVRFFAQRIPEANIQATVTLFGKGGGSGGTGSVSIGQGLKRDESGAIAVHIGEGLDFDSANALTVKKGTVMTVDDFVDENNLKQDIEEILK